MRYMEILGRYDEHLVSLTQSRSRTQGLTRILNNRARTVRNANLHPNPRGKRCWT